MGNYLEKMKLMDMGEKGNSEHIAEVEHQMNIKLPLEYVEFMKLHNGAEGEIGENSYLAIWTIEEIVDLNNEYGASEFTPGLVYFGSDGGEMIYAFDMRSEKKSIVELPAITITADDAVFLADSFAEFIACLYNR